MERMTFYYKKKKYTILNDLKNKKIDKILLLDCIFNDAHWKL